MDKDKKRKYILFNKNDGRDVVKPCAFFLSEAGCRNGSSCQFFHGPAGGVPVVDNIIPAAKIVSNNSVDKKVKIQETKPVVKTPSKVVHEKVVEIKPEPAKVPKAKVAETPKKEATMMAITPVQPIKYVSKTEEDDNRFLFSAVNVALKGGLPPTPSTGHDSSSLTPYMAGATVHSPSASSPYTQVSGKKKRLVKPEEPLPMSAPLVPSNPFLQPNEVVSRLSSSNTTHATLGPKSVQKAETGKVSQQYPKKSSQIANVQSLQAIPVTVAAPGPVATPFSGIIPVVPAQIPKVPVAPVAPVAPAPAPKPIVKPQVNVNPISVLESLVLKTRAHPSFSKDYAFNVDNSWVKPKAFGDWSNGKPLMLSIDCEMCETTDPVTDVKESSLIRISIVSGASIMNSSSEKEYPTLLDSLVNPLLPISDCRTNIHGIKEEQVVSVSYTLRHAQAALLGLCSDRTVIVGHSLHNDLKALKVYHPSMLFIDTSYLFELENEPGRLPGVRDIAHFTGVNANLPSNRLHDSVGDASMALQFVQYLVSKAGEGSTETPIVPRVGNGLNQPAGQCLMVHRIPHNLSVEDLKTLFISTCFIVPANIQPITYSGDNTEEGNANGKTVVTFASEAHANMAFEAISGPNRPDKSKKPQKRVYLKAGGYIYVRKY